VTQAASLQEIWDQSLSASSDSVDLILINNPGYESGLPDLAAVTSLPILQDTHDDDVADTYGASNWYIYLVDGQGYPRAVWYLMDLDAERDRLLDSISALMEEL